MKKAILLTMFKRLTLLWSLLFMTCFMASATVEHKPSDMVPAATINSATDTSQKFYMAKYNNDNTTGWWYFHVNGYTSTEGSTVETTEKNVGGSSYVWTLKRVKDNVYEIYNEKYGFYLTNASSTTVTLTKDESNAGQYAITASDITSNAAYVEGSCFVEPQNRTGYYFSCNTSGTKLCVESGKDKGRQILFVPTTFTGATPDASDYADPDPAYIHYNELSDGLRVFLGHDTYGTTPVVETYCYASKGTTFSLINSSATPTGWTYVWELKKVDIDGVDNVYYLYNEYTDTYIGKTGSTIGLVTSKDDAGRYMIVKSGDTSSTFDIDAVELRDYDNQSKGLNTNKNLSYLQTDNVGGCNNQFHLTPCKYYRGTMLLNGNMSEVMIRPYANHDSDNPYYVKANSLDDDASFSTEVTWYSTWCFERLTETTTDSENKTTTTVLSPERYYIYNTVTKDYIGKIPDSGSNNKIQLVSDVSDAGQFILTSPDDDAYAILMQDYTTQNAESYLLLNANAGTTENYIYNGSIDDANNAYFYLSETSTDLPLRTAEYVRHHNDLYMAPYYMKDGYVNAIGDMEMMETTKEYDNWNSVWTLEDTTLKEDDIDSAKDDYNVATMEEYLQRAYRLYSRLDRKYVGKITSTEAGNIVSLVDTKEEAGLYKFDLDPKDASGVVISDTENSSKYCYLYANASHQIVNGAAIENGAAVERSIFYLSRAQGESFAAIEDGAKITISPYRAYNYVLKQDVVHKEYPVTKEPTRTEYSTWTLKKAYVTGLNENDSNDGNLNENVYYIYNEATGMYIGKIGTKARNLDINSVTDTLQAGRYKIRQDNEFPAGINFRDVDADTDAKWLNMNYTSTGGVFNLVCYPYEEANRAFYCYGQRKELETAKDYVDLEDGMVFKVIPYRYFDTDIWPGASQTDHSEGFVNVTADGTTIYPDLTAHVDGDKDYTLFQLVQAKDANGDAIPNVWLIKNVATGTYVPPTTNGSATAHLGMTTDATKAGHYEILWDYWDQTTVYFHDVDNNPSSSNVDNDYSWWRWNQSSSYSSDTNGMEINGNQNVVSSEAANDRNRFYIYPADKPVDLVTDQELLDLFKWILVNTGDYIGDFIPEKYQDANDTFTKMLQDHGYSIEQDSREQNSEISKGGSVVDLDLSDFTADELQQLRDLYTEVLKNTEDEETRQHPKPRRLYFIESAFDADFYKEAGIDDYEADLVDVKLAETYLEKDYHIKQDKQRVHYNFSDWENYQVPMMWEFLYHPTEEGTDAICYFKLKAANSGKTMRMTSYNTVVDVRDSLDGQSALYSILKSDICTRPHSVGLKSHYDNPKRTGNTGYQLLGIWSTDSHFLNITNDVSVRDGYNDIVTNPRTQNANIWRIWEVKEFPIFFYFTGNFKENIKQYISTFIFPFDVELPEGLKAYSGGYGNFKHNDGKKHIDLVEFEMPDGKRNVIPANSPAIIIADTEYAPNGDDWKVKILNYGINPDGSYEQSPYQPVTGLGLVGSCVPVAVPNGTVAYVFHDDRDDEATKVVGGTDFSFSNEGDVFHTNSGDGTKYNYQLHDDDTSFYVMKENTAYILATADAPDNPTITINPDITTSVQNITIDDYFHNNGYREPERDANGNLIYYDLMGRRTVNPTTGIYILTNGQKVVVR
jgi:hypothetical protein